MSVKWTAVKRTRNITIYEQPRTDIASWLAKHAGTQGLNGDWYMTSTTKGHTSTYTYRFRDKNIALLFKLTFGGTI